MKHILLNLSLFLLILFTGCKNSEQTNVNLVTVEEMETILEMDGVQLIDVRTPEEFSEGFIEGAQNIDFYSDTFDQDILKLDKTKPVVLYCKSGGRSAKCSEKLIEAGFIKVYDLDGGITQWKHNGLGVDILN
ncbi:rhodanese-like domain-containing protein [Xanthomarina sp. GH4-25]|uniref:rhodanese-like domain-containing protein n=1 Tax=Xanthomarina sp. GH4-25 TaxID=3349335 RepID=UPI003877BF16